MAAAIAAVAIPAVVAILAVAEVVGAIKLASNYIMCKKNPQALAVGSFYTLLNYTAMKHTFIDFNVSCPYFLVTAEPSEITINLTVISEPVL